MAAKRGFEEVASPDPETGSPAPEAFKKRKHNTKNKHRPNEGSIEYAKKRARNIDRLLNRNQDLPADVRNELVRELAAHQATISDKAFQKKRSAMIAKYHMVRFFERRKATRLAKQLRRKIQQSTSEEETEKLKKDLHVAEVDEAYTQHFPHAEPYISLYTNPKSGDADDKEEDEEDKPQLAKALLSVQRPPMWSVVEKAMEEGPDALRKLRERRSLAGSQPRTQKERRPQKPKTSPNANAPSKPVQRGGQPQRKNGEIQPALNRRERRKLMRQAAAQAVVEKSDDDSDGGGFFEED